MWHLADAWARRDEPNVLLVHYADLSSDLDGQMRGIAGQLGISVPEQIWPSLVVAATFTHMKSRADDLVPNRAGILKDNAASTSSSSTTSTCSSNLTNAPTTLPPPAPPTANS